MEEPLKDECFGTIPKLNYFLLAHCPSAMAIFGKEEAE